MINLWAGHLVASLNIFGIAQYIYEENKYIFVRVNIRNSERFSAYYGERKW